MINVNEQKISNTPRFFMVFSVPLILFLLLLLGFNNIIPLKVEIHSIVIIFLILLIFMFFIPHNAWYSYTHFKNSISNVIEEIDQHLSKKELVLAGRKKAMTNIEPFFDDYVKTIRNDNFASIASSIFPTLGILGTFLAIAISMPDFSVESKAALENEITILLSGVGTAFYASIYGIFLSIWWVFFEKRGLTKIENEVNSLISEYSDLIWDKEEIELYKILENQEQNKRFIEKIEKVITPEYIFKLDDIAKAKLKQLETLDEEFKVAEHRVTKNYVAFSKLLEETSTKQHELLNSFLKVEQSIVNNIAESQKNSKAVNSEIYSVLSSFELVSRDLKALGKDLLDAK